MLTMKTAARGAGRSTLPASPVSKPGVSHRRAAGESGGRRRRLKRQYPAPDDWTLDAVPLQDAIVGDVGEILYVLLGAVGSCC